MNTASRIACLPFVLAIFLVASLPLNARAQVVVLPPPPAPASASADVSDHCTVVDTDGNSHDYSGQHLGICALVAANDQGVVSAYTLKNFSFGLFLESLNGTVPGATEYWAIKLNGADTVVGLTDLVLTEGDSLSFQLTDWSTNTSVGSPVTFTVHLVASAAANAATGGGLTFLAPEFDKTAAVIFLRSTQNADGALPNPLLSDWAAFAFASHRVGDSYERLLDYFLTWKPELSNVTDYERHTMALMALGIDPYSGTGFDYVSPIVDAFDGAQVGDPSLVNDDVFAVFPLLHAGYRAEDSMMQTIRDAILGAQKEDGSWEESVDMTAAAIQALRLFERTGKVHTALNRAELYLLNSQKEDGGFGNSFSTAWAMQAIAAIGNSHNTWTKGAYNTPQYYFREMQQDDGGVEPKTVDSFTRLWATAYALPALTGKPWDALMAYFTKPHPYDEVPSVPDAPATGTPTTTLVAAPETARVAVAQTKADSPSADAPEGDPGNIATTTRANQGQNAAAASAAGGRDIGTMLWVAGIIAVLGVAYFFRRRLPAGKAGAS